VTATPRPPSLWEQATSSRGGRWAVAIALAAVCLLVATAAVALAASARQDRGGLAAATDLRAQPQGSGTTTKDKGNGDLNSLPGRLGGTLHGEVTRPNAAGGTETLLVQTGSVTASSDTQLTVKSSDGFTATYAISDATTVRGPAKAAGLAIGTQVTVVAAKDGTRALLIASKGKPS
jgi:hypothetical protein